MEVAPLVLVAAWNCRFASSFFPGPFCWVQCQLVGQGLDDSHCWVLTSPQQCCLALTASWRMPTPEGPSNGCTGESEAWASPSTWTVAC